MNKINALPFCGLQQWTYKAKEVHFTTDTQCRDSNSALVVNFEQARRLLISHWQSVCYSNGIETKLQKERRLSRAAFIMHFSRRSTLAIENAHLSVNGETDFIYRGNVTGSKVSAAFYQRCQLLSANDNGPRDLQKTFW